MGAGTRKLHHAPAPLAMWALAVQTVLPVQQVTVEPLLTIALLILAKALLPLLMTGLTGTSTVPTVVQSEETQVLAPAHHAMQALVGQTARLLMLVKLLLPSLMTDQTGTSTALAEEVWGALQALALVVPVALVLVAQTVLNAWQVTVETTALLIPVKPLLLPQMMVLTGTSTASVVAMSAGLQGPAHARPATLGFQEKIAKVQYTTSTTWTGSITW